ncbi:hypothetical protein ACROYT_G015227 [Oculina patagonica]
MVDASILLSFKVDFFESMMKAFHKHVVFACVPTRKQLAHSRVAATNELPCAEDVPVFGGGAVELLSHSASIYGDGSVVVQGVVLSTVNGRSPDKSVDILDFLGKQVAVPDMGLFRVKEGALFKDNCGSTAEETFFKGGDCLIWRRWVGRE